MLNVFRNHCTTCHGKLKQEAGLDLRTRAGLLKGGKSGPALTAGKPDESLVYTLIASGKMPPAGIEGSPHMSGPSELMTSKDCALGSRPEHLTTQVKLLGGRPAGPSGKRRGPRLLVFPAAATS